MKIIKKSWGSGPDGHEINHYILENGKGIKAGITNYGGIVTFIEVPDQKGNAEDVTLGFDNLKDYQKGHPYFGALIGRYGNRIKDGRFTLNGRSYSLATNDGIHHLHGGLKGFDKVIWNVEEIWDSLSVGLKLSYTSPDGEEGYPGTLTVNVIFRLTTSNALDITYEAVTDKPTPVNLTHHSYFNLCGAGKGDVLSHALTIRADSITAVDDNLIPTGALLAVRGTPFDFNVAKAIGTEIKEVPGGYDHNFVLNKKNGEYSLAAKLSDDVSGRSMEVYTTEPGMQFYSGNFLDGSITGKKGRTYHKHYGLCLEAQHFPDSPNQASFPDVILMPGEKYSQKTSYVFSW